MLQVLNILLFLQLPPSAEAKYVFECTVSGSVVEVRKEPLSTFLEKCKNATHLKLIEPDIFTPGTLTENQVNTIFQISHIDMCIKISHAPYTELIFLMKSLTGKCKGPFLDITMNNLLKKIEGDTFISGLRNQPDSIRIRGNRRLSATVLKKFKGFRDVQHEGECAMPLQIGRKINFRNCTYLYGPLVVGIDVEKVEIQAVHDHFVYTGCVQIIDTLLTDLAILERFRNFTPIKDCEQCEQTNNITRNLQLCVENPSEIRATFPGVRIYQNYEPCKADQCRGGAVTEEYLEETANCTTRIGDVVLAQWKKKPHNIDVLYKTREVRGRLVIYGNKGLGDFDYFKNLEIVGTPNVEGNAPAMAITGNEDLTSLKMPKLTDVTQHETVVRIKIDDNKKLNLSRREVNRFMAAAGGPTYTDIHHGEEKSTKLPPSTSNSSKKLQPIVFFILPGVILLLIVIIVIALIIVKKRSHSALPPPPFRLSNKSKTILGEMCKEILTKNPMVWRIQDRQLIWRYSKDDPKREVVSGLANKHSNFLQNHSAVLVPNARILAANARMLYSRIQCMSSNSLVIMISKTNDVSDIVPYLPSEVGKSYDFQDMESTIRFTLLKNSGVGERTIDYLYSVESLQKGTKCDKKNIRVLLYVWGTLRLRNDFEELLRVLRLFAKKRPVCVSERRKELFSLLHLIYTYVYELQQSINVVEAFQLHTDNCNGAPLDSSEMLCAMSFILEWARRSSSVPAELTQKHANWCDLYDQMSTFSREHSNIINILPAHIDTKRQKELQDEIEHAGPRIGAAFSERSEVPIKDNFRRLTKQELKQRKETNNQKGGKKKSIMEEESGTNLGLDTTGATATQRCRAAGDDPQRKEEEKRVSEVSKNAAQTAGKNPKSETKPNVVVPNTPKTK
ncbi:hypothetical protein RB195_007639 [Necator americanus]